MGIGDTYQENGTASIRENFEWDRLWWEHIEDNTKKRVLIIGDSISGNFRWRMVDELKGEIHPDGFSSSKALDNPYLLESIKLFSKQSPKYDAVYVNNGLHGWHLSAEEYEKYYFIYNNANFWLYFNKIPYYLQKWCNKWNFALWQSDNTVYFSFHNVCSLFNAS